MSIAFWHDFMETGGRIWLQAGAVGLGRMTFPIFGRLDVIAKVSFKHSFFEYLPDGLGLNEVYLFSLS